MENPFAGTENQTINIVGLVEQKYKIVRFGQKKASGSTPRWLFLFSGGGGFPPPRLLFIGEYKTRLRW